MNGTQIPEISAGIIGQTERSHLSGHGEPRPLSKCVPNSAFSGKNTQNTRNLEVSAQTKTFATSDWGEEGKRRGMCEILALKDLLTNPTHKQRRITLAAELSARLPLQLVKVFKKKTAVHTPNWLIGPPPGWEKADANQTRS